MYCDAMLPCRCTSVELKLQSCIVAQPAELLLLDAEVFLTLEPKLANYFRKLGPAINKQSRRCFLTLISKKEKYFAIYKSKTFSYNTAAYRVAST